MDKLTGGCLCRAVRFEIQAEPLMAVNCHCLSCRSLSGGGHSSLAAFPADAVAVTGDAKAYGWTADSGARISTEFCATCGSPLFGRSNHMEGLILVRLGSLDDPNAVSPQMEIYTKRALDWDPANPNLPAFPEMPPMD